MAAVSVRKPQVPGVVQPQICVDCRYAGTQGGDEHLHERCAVGEDGSHRNQGSEDNRGRHKPEVLLLVFCTRRPVILHLIDNPALDIMPGVGVFHFLDKIFQFLIQR